MTTVQHHNSYESFGAAIAALGMSDHYMKKLQAMLVVGLREGMICPDTGAEMLLVLDRAFCRLNVPGHVCPQISPDREAAEKFAAKIARAAARFDRDNPS